MKNRIHSPYDDPRLPVEVRDALRKRAATVSRAAYTLIKHTRTPVVLAEVPVKVGGRTFNNLCLFVGGMMVTSFGVIETGENQ